MTETLDLTIDNFTERTGFRFRLLPEQNARVKAGTLTREQAFQDFLNSGGLERRQQEKNGTAGVPDSIFADPNLTVENFSNKVEALTGKARRFRVTADQNARIKAGSLTREQAFQETLNAKRNQ